MDKHVCAGQRDALDGCSVVSAKAERSGEHDWHFPLVHFFAGIAFPEERWLFVKQEQHEDMLTQQIRNDLYAKMSEAPVPTPVRADHAPPTVEAIGAAGSDHAAMVSWL